MLHSRDKNKTSILKREGLILASGKTQHSQVLAGLPE